METVEEFREYVAVERRNLRHYRWKPSTIGECAARRRGILFGVWLLFVLFVCFFHFNFNFGGRNEKNGSENATGNARNDAENTTGEIGRESTTASVAIRFLSNRWVSFWIVSLIVIVKKTEEIDQESKVPLALDVRSDILKKNKQRKHNRRQPALPFASYPIDGSHFSFSCWENRGNQSRIKYFEK